MFRHHLFLVLRFLSLGFCGQAHGDKREALRIISGWIQEKRLILDPGKPLIATSGDLYVAGFLANLDALKWEGYDHYPGALFVMFALLFAFVYKEAAWATLPLGICTAVSCIVYVIT